MATTVIDCTAPPAATLAATTNAYAPVRLCRCGHEQEVHEHHRAGHDCSVCGPARCSRYRRRTGRTARSPFRR